MAALVAIASLVLAAVVAGPAGLAAHCSSEMVVAALLLCTSGKLQTTPCPSHRLLLAPVPIHLGVHLRVHVP